MINNSFYEMINSANQAWTMYPGLSHGVYACLHAHGTPEQQALYLPKLVSGEWTGTMCLTESHCGTDLDMLRSKAESQSDGSYSITGSKIFISAGEHDLSQNITHPVLARLPGAPEGAKGISLFLVRHSSCRTSTARWVRVIRSSAAPSKKKWASTAIRPAR